MWLLTGFSVLLVVCRHPTEEEEVSFFPPSVPTTHALERSTGQSVSGVYVITATEVLLTVDPSSKLRSLLLFVVECICQSFLTKGTWKVH